MAKYATVDSVGREIWVDDRTNQTFTEGGTRSTGYDLEGWNERQLKEQSKGRFGGSKESSSKDPVTQYVDSIIESQKQAIKDQTKFLKDYEKNNPFAFDEELARQSSTAEYDPYYSELLTDYLADIDVQRETVQDDQALAETLKKYDDASANRQFTTAVQKTRQGFAGRGLYFSGLQERGVGEQEVDFMDQTGRRDSIFQNQMGGYQSQLGMLDTAGQRKERDIERQKKEAIEGGVLQRESEAIKQYNVPLVQSYTRRFGSSDPNNALSGYLIPEGLKY